MTDQENEPRMNVNFRLAPAVVAHVDTLAQIENQSRSQMLRILVSEAIQRRAR